MADFFNKVKKGFNKGTTTIGIKSSTMMETNKLKGEISSLKREKTEVFTSVGDKYYSMKKEDLINIEELNTIIVRAFEIDLTIAQKEQAIEDALKKQEETLRALQEVDSSTIVEHALTCSCGAPISTETKFCPKCGQKIQHEEIEIVQEEIEDIQEEIQGIQAEEVEVELVIEPTTIICECGAELTSDTIFCAQCGRKLLSI